MLTRLKTCRSYLAMLCQLIAGGTEQLAGIQFSASHQISVTTSASCSYSHAIAAHDQSVAPLAISASRSV